MSSHARLQHFIRPVLRYLTVSALLLFFSASIHAAQDVILRLDPGGHTAQVSDLLITPGGKLVTASFDKTIRIWNPKTGREERKILGQLGPGPEGMIYAIALSPDGKLLASGGWTHPECAGQCGNIRLHDFHSGELLQTLKGHENVVQDLAFSPDGRWLASGSGDYTVRLWKRSGSRFTKGPVLQGHENDVYAVRLFEDSGRLRVVSASYDHTVRLWDAESGRQLTIGRHEDEVVSLTLGPDWIASSGVDNTIRIWALPGTAAQKQDDAAAAPIRELAGHGGPITSLAVAGENADQLISGSQDGSVRHWNAADGKQLRQMDHGGPVTAAARSH